MAWPPLRADNFLPTSAAWNEIVNALSQWGGNVNGGGYTLSNVILDGDWSVDDLTVSGDLTVEGTFSVGTLAVGTLEVVDLVAVTGTFSGSVNSALYMLNGVPLTGALQTPWTQNIEAAGFSLKNVGLTGIGNDGTLPSASNAAYTNLVVGSQTSNIAFGSLVLCGKVSALGAAVGQISFANHEIVAAEKRIAAVNAVTAGATNSGRLDFYTWDAGAVALRMQVSSAGVGIGGITPAYKLDVSGDCNITGTYRVNGVPISTGGSGSQTPWLSNIDGNSKSLTNVAGLGVASGRSTFFATNEPYAVGLGYVAAQAATDMFFLGLTSNGGTAGAGRFCLSNAGGAAILTATYGGLVGIGNQAPGYRLDVGGDLNLSPGGVYRIGGVPISTGTGQNQTPWLSDIDGGGIYKLKNVAQIAVNAAAPQAGVQLHVRTGANANLWVQAGAYTGATALSAGNDLGSLNTPLELRGNPCIINLGKVGIGSGTATPSNILSVHEAQADPQSASAVSLPWSRGLMVQGVGSSYDGACIQMGAASGLGWAIKQKCYVGNEGVLSFYGFRSATGSAHEVLTLSGADGSTTVQGNLNVAGSIIGNVGNFNVMAYGAKGDGATGTPTNDYLAVQAAVDAAVGAGGGVVYFPSGKTYLINGTVLIRGANITISAYGATLVTNQTSFTMFLHDQHGGLFSHFRFLGGLFRGPGATANGVIGIYCLGLPDGSKCPRMLTIKDVDFENITYGVCIDKCDDVLVDNVKCLGNTQLYAGSTSDTGAQSYSHRVVFSNIFYYPPASGSPPSFIASPAGAGYAPAFIVFQRAGGGSITNLQICSLRDAADGVHIVNDSQGIHIDGLIIQAKWGVRLVQTNMGSGIKPPLSNTLSGIDIDMYGIGAIHVGGGVLDTRIRNCGLTGYNVKLGTEQHAILQDSAGDTLIQGCWFQNIKWGNGITVNTGAHHTFISDNYFADNAMNGSCIHIAAGITNCYVSANFRSSLDASAIFINNLAGAGAVVTNNYPTQAVVVEDPEGE